MKLTAEEADNFWNKIGAPKYIMAPMVNGSDLAYRLFCLKYNTDLAYTPMLHSRLLYECRSYYKKNFPNIRKFGEYEEKFVIAQVCGSDPKIVVNGCKTIENFVDAIDLNCGCPQDIARRGGYGAYLLKRQDKMLEVIEAMVNELVVPIFVKIRILEEEVNDEEIYFKINDSSKKPLAVMNKLSDEKLKEKFHRTIDLVKKIELLGVAAITIHARSIFNKNQKIGSSNWDLLRYIRSIIKIPLIANGSIPNKEAANECIEFTKCSAVMVAEGILNNPLIFANNPVPLIDALIELHKLYKEIGVDDFFQFKSHIWHILYPYYLHDSGLVAKISSLKKFDDFDELVNELPIYINKVEALENKPKNYYYRHMKK